MNILVSSLATLVVMFSIPSTTYYEAPVVHVEEIKHEVLATITAYTSSSDETDDNPWETAAGTVARKGIAACPSKYEFGTKVVIGEDEYTCEDRMNKRYRHTERFDIWMTSKEEALKWGKKQLTVEIKK